jgi:hypothetical protein
MENIRNFFGQVKNRTPNGPTNVNSSTAASMIPNQGTRTRSDSGDFSQLDGQKNNMKQYKTGDRDSYYYIL